MRIYCFGIDFRLTSVIIFAVMSLLGTPGVLLDMLSPSKRTESSNSNISKVSLKPTTLCLQEVHGKYEQLQAIQVLASRFRFFGTSIPDYENAGGLAICIHRDLLPEETIVTHLISCQGRDHLVNINLGDTTLLLLTSILNPNLP